MPDPEPPFAVLLSHLILVTDPILVPPEDGSRVVDTKDVNILYFETSCLELGNDPAKRAGSIGAREDVFIHEEAPDEIFILPGGTEASDLEDEDAIIIKEIVDLTEKGTITTDTDVLKSRCQYHISGHRIRTYLSHFEGNDFGKVARCNGDITVIRAENPGLVRAYTVGLDPVITKLGLVLGQCDTSGIATEVLGCICSQGAPPTTNVKKTIFGSKVKLGADDRELIVLEFF